MFPRWKAAVAAVLAAVLAWCGALALVGWYQPAQQADLPMSGQKRLHSVELPILMYHHIHKSASQWGDHVVSPQTLEGDFQYLTAQGYTAVTVADLTAYTQNGTPLPEKPIMITFDDGYVSNYRLLFPLLQKYQMKAAICLIVSLTDKDPEGHGHLTWDMCREMQASGLVEIASHTYALHNLEQNGDYFAKGVNGIQRKTGESSWQFQMRVLTDLKKSRDILQRELGTAPQLFAYPYGETEPDAEAYLRRLFPMTVITGKGEIGTLEGRYHLPRISVCQETQLGDRLL